MAGKCTTTNVLQMARKPQLLQLLTKAPVTPVSSSCIMSLNNGVGPLGQHDDGNPGKCRLLHYPAPPSNLQRNTANQTWCNMLLEVFSWTLWLMHYGCQRRRIRIKIRRKVGNVEGALYMWVHLCWEARLAICTAPFPLPHG